MPQRLTGGFYEVEHTMPSQRRCRPAPDIRREFKRLSNGLSFGEYRQKHGEQAARSLQAKASANVR